MSYSRMDTPSFSARRRAATSAWTLKPKMMAWEEEASNTSFSLILPVSAYRMLILISPLPRLLISLIMGSREPCTSALRIRLNSCASPALILENNSSRVIFLATVACFVLESCRSWMIWWASFSVLTTWNRSPAEGNSLNPITETGTDGPAFWILRPRKSKSARSRP